MRVPEKTTFFNWAVNLLWTQKEGSDILKQHKWPGNSVASFFFVACLYVSTTNAENDFER